MARPSKPWFRASKNTWYVTVEGEKVSLGVRGPENKAEAITAWHRLMADDRPKPEEKAKAPAVAALTKGFLDDCEGRLKPSTIQGYRHFLTPFSDQHGSLRADKVTAKIA